jgi:hypothetical protein
MPAIEFQTVVKDDMIRIPEEYRGRIDATVQVVILLNKPVETGVPYQVQSSHKLRINRLYGAFRETPIPDKSELRKQFHEESTR